MLIVGCLYIVKALRFEMSNMVNGTYEHLSTAYEKNVDRGANKRTLLAHTYSILKQYGAVYKRDHLVTGQHIHSVC